LLTGKRRPIFSLPFTFRKRAVPWAENQAREQRRINGLPRISQRKRNNDMTISDQVLLPLAPVIGQITECRVERPGCGHMVTIKAYMMHNRIPASEQESIKAQLAEPCPVCVAEAKKEKKKDAIS